MATCSNALRAGAIQVDAAVGAEIVYAQVIHFYAASFLRRFVTKAKKRELIGRNSRCQLWSVGQLNGSYGQCVCGCRSVEKGKKRRERERKRVMRSNCGSDSFEALAGCGGRPTVGKPAHEQRLAEAAVRALA